MTEPWVEEYLLASLAQDWPRSRELYEEHVKTPDDLLLVLKYVAERLGVPPEKIVAALEASIERREARERLN